MSNEFQYTQNSKVRYCSYNGCKGRSDSVKIFKMPSGDKDLQFIWRSFIKSSGKKNVNSKYLYLCKYHFDPDDIIDQTRRIIIRPGALPKYKDVRVS